MGKDKITLPVQFVKPVFKVDRSVSLVFETRELTGIEAAILLDYRQNEGWLLFSPNPDIKEEEVPDEKADSMTGQRTQAQRLRGVLYRLWEKRGKKGDFEDFYKVALERIIDQAKEKLD